jgi:homoserine kinase type II
LSRNDLEVIREAFGLGDVRRVTFLAQGLMNRNWRIDTDAGSYALKLLCDVPVDLASRNASVLAALTSAGLPVCAPLIAATGNALFETGSRAYLVSRWADGEHVEGTQLTMAQAAEFGRLVATIHRRLGDLARSPALAPAVRPRAKVTDPDRAVDKADRLLAVISGLSVPTDFDVRARALLEDRIALLGKHRQCVPAVVDGLPGAFGWTHGDLQHRNVLWSAGSVTAVLDWDRIGVRPLGEEVARTAQVQFGGEHGFLDLERVAAFVTGYRSVVPLPRADLADAVERLWWKRMSDYWIFEFHYDRDDYGPDSLLVPSERFLAWWTDRRADVQQAFAAGG